MHVLLLSDSDLYLLKERTGGEPPSVLRGYLLPLAREGEGSPPVQPHIPGETPGLLVFRLSCHHSQCECRREFVGNLT